MWFDNYPFLLSDPCIAKEISMTCRGKDGQDKICPIDGRILDIVRVSTKDMTCVGEESFGITEDKRGVWVDNGCKVKFRLKVCDGMYRKVPKISDARNLCCNLPNIQTKRPKLRVFYQKDANGIANS